MDTSNKSFWVKNISNRGTCNKIFFNNAVNIQSAGTKFKTLGKKKNNEILDFCASNNISW